MRTVACERVSEGARGLVERVGADGPNEPVKEKVGAQSRMLLSHLRALGALYEEVFPCCEIEG